MKKKKEEAELKLDLGSGDVVEPGFTGVDSRSLKGVQRTDLVVYPWPWKDSSVSEARAVHLLQYLSAEGRMRFADELFRVLKPGGKCSIVVPHWNGARALQDPLAKWPAVSETYFCYWNAEWRKANKADWYGLKCDFDFTYGYTVNQPWTSKAEEPRNFAIANYSNSVLDLYVNLTSRKK